MRPQPMTRQALAHFQTFARLHDARPADAPALRALADSLAAGPGGERPGWPLLMDASGAHVLVATEGELTVGAVVVWHHKDTAQARLSWLGVSHAARGRGVGSLLLESAIAAVAAHRAEAITARLPPEGEPLAQFLLHAGFMREKGSNLRLLLGSAAS